VENMIFCHIRRLVLQLRAHGVPEVVVAVTERVQRT
jgi:hypothetical protein